MANVQLAFYDAMGPETYLDVTLNRVKNKSVSLSGQPAAEFLEVDTLYQIEVGISPGKKYSEKRESIFALEQAMNLGNVFNYIPPSTGTFANPVGPCQYQGDIPRNDRGDLVSATRVTLASATLDDTTIYVNTLPVTANISPGGYLIRAGSYIQLNRQPYQATEDVLFTSNSSVAVPVNRRLMLDTASVYTFYLGNPQWRVKFAEANPYTIQPHDRLAYLNDTAKLIEVIEPAP